MEIEIQKIIRIAEIAGEEILKIYKKDFEISHKEDDSFKSGFSLLTEADLAADSIIKEKLKESFPEIPVLSEEGGEIPYEERKNWEKFWMVDPLDGTKEFVNKTGEFTVNIALIKNKKPVLGVVCVPIKETCYYTDKNGAFKKTGDGKIIKLPVESSRKNFVVVASRSHKSEKTDELIQDLNDGKKIEVLSMGSSLKLCLVAEGVADIYPRLAPSKEWDTAAAHAIVNAAGKKVLEYGKENELKYNKENLLNPGFIVK